MQVSSDINKNIEILENDFKDSADFVKRKFPIGENNILVYIAYIEQMIDSQAIDRFVVDNLMTELNGDIQTDKKTFIETVKNKCIAKIDIKEETDIQKAESNILNGSAIVLIDGSNTAITVSANKFPNRGVQQAETEVVVKGSKEAFTEPMRMNTALLRKRIKDTRLKMKQITLGQITTTSVTISYIEGLVRPQILKEVERQLRNTKLDSVLNSNYVQQLLETDWKSVFPQVETTERPDKATGALLEGRIVIIIDNTPFVIIVPVTLNSFFQSAEDYAERWQIVSFVRLLRFAAGILATVLPGLYIAITLYHPEMLPTELVLKMAGSRENVPFPGIVEIFMMELAFELLREAGIRMPSPIGSTIGIVGGIIIGQSAVEAGVVSPIIVIIVSITAICSFAIPHVSLVAAFRLTKFLILFLSAILGLYGFWLGVLLILIHLVSLKSYNIPYMFPFVSSSVNDYTDFKDSIIRVPLFMMKKRPIFSNPKNVKRIK